ncbi:MAG: hypothetical protein JJE30_11150 [Desulfuromonadales bacterium]|nr:hypothetical protein [Desulfuromonadales bacterium]
MNLYKEELAKTDAKASWKACNGDWMTVFQDAFSECDAVIAVGGGKSGTRPLIEAALAAWKPVVLIPSFEGQAAAAWQSVEGHYSEEESQELQKDYTPDKWAEGIVNVAINIAERAKNA